MIGQRQRHAVARRDLRQGTRTISFVDDTEHQRFKQVTPEGDTLYIAGFGVLAEISNPGTASAKWTEYLSVGNAKVGMRSLQAASETLATRYFHTDQFGKSRGRDAGARSGERRDCRGLDRRRPL